MSPRTARACARRKRAWLEYQMLRAHPRAGPRARFWALAWDTAYHRALRIELETPRKELST